MNKTVILAVGIGIIVIIGGMFAYSSYMKNRIADDTTQIPPVEEEEQEEVRINGVHVYSDGSHTVIGEVMLPTPCHLLDANAIVAESMPEQVTIALSTIEPDAGTMCAQVMTAQRFRVDFDASEQAVLRATFDGRPAILNLQEGDPSTDLDELGEFYFKG